MSCNHIPDHVDPRTEDYVCACGSVRMSRKAILTGGPAPQRENNVMDFAFNLGQEVCLTAAQRIAARGNGVAPRRYVIISRRWEEGLSMRDDVVCYEIRGIVTDAAPGVVDVTNPGWVGEGELEAWREE